VIDLRRDSAQVEKMWRSSPVSCVPLAVAAALTFHQTRRGNEERLPPNDYARALDIAAAALSCLVPIYTVDERGEQIAVCMNLARQRFCGGAARLQCLDGAVFAPLTIVRSDVPPVLPAIQCAQIDYVAPQPLARAAASPFDERVKRRDW
jgi:hypothetical protein